ncbi:uncharacterized protein TNCT_492751 [Trichonephila clavata]|uniref:Uncharacterized protein n=1 Tax=Trichonephila clavata TaxID=2740835 RepID=A0A8X6I0J5_TRICU|nr:uncharacterized protein TNCT_492751 [Trichonephila clavata]
MGSNETHSEKNEEKWPLPTAAIFCLAMSLYIILLIIGILIRKCLIARGICKDCCPVLKSNTNCCGVCGNCAQQCNWKLPTVDNCLDAICPSKQVILLPSTPRLRFYPSQSVTGQMYSAVVKEVHTPAEVVIMHLLVKLQNVKT